MNRPIPSEQVMNNPALAMQDAWFAYRMKYGLSLRQTATMMRQEVRRLLEETEKSSS